MLSIFGKIWGTLVLIAALVCLLPLLGWINWLVIVFAIIGCIISAFTETNSGLILNIVAIVIAGFRLIIGGGVI